MLGRTHSARQARALLRPVLHPECRASVLAVAEGSVAFIRRAAIAFTSLADDLEDWRTPHNHAPYMRQNECGLLLVPGDVVMVPDGVKERGLTPGDSQRDTERLPIRLCPALGREATG